MPLFTPMITIEKTDWNTPWIRSKIYLIIRTLPCTRNCIWKYSHCAGLVGDDYGYLCLTRCWSVISRPAYTGDPVSNDMRHHHDHSRVGNPERQVQKRMRIIVSQCDIFCSAPSYYLIQWNLNQNTKCSSVITQYSSRQCVCLITHGLTKFVGNAFRGSFTDKIKRYAGIKARINTYINVQ